MALRRGSCRLLTLLGNRSQTWFADRMGVNRSTVSRWASGDWLMSYERMVQGCRILGCHAEDFYEMIEITDGEE